MNAGWTARLRRGAGWLMFAFALALAAQCYRSVMSNDTGRRYNHPRGPGLMPRLFR
jgi:hypothetical protein